MSSHPSPAERLDHAIDRLLDGASPGAAAATATVPAPDRPLVGLAGRVRDVLVVPTLAPRFEARLGARLSGVNAAHTVGWARRNPGRLIVTGAVGSAVGVGVTAFAVWRSQRRAPSVAHRLLHR